VRFYGRNGAIIRSLFLLTQFRIFFTEWEKNMDTIAPGNKKRPEGGLKMDTAILRGLRNMREDLLRQYVLSNNREKADVFNKIIDVEEQIEMEEAALHKVLT